MNLATLSNFLAEIIIHLGTGKGSMFVNNKRGYLFKFESHFKTEIS